MSENHNGTHPKGRAVVAGLLAAVWLGLLLGIGIASKWDITASWTPFHLLGLFLINVVIVIVLRVLLGHKR